MPPISSRNSTGPAPRSEPKEGHVSKATPFWRTKKLAEMTRAEWESLCDRCGRCCLVKLEDEDTGEIHKTDIACKLLDAGACACKAYATRQRQVDDCLKLTPKMVRRLKWLPSTCAYRLVDEGKSLEAWHPLISGSPDSVHEAGISVRGRVGGAEGETELEDYVDHIIDWAD